MLSAAQWPVLEPLVEACRPGVHFWDMGGRPVIPPRRDEAPVSSPACYVSRNRVERLWARLKERRAVATRYEKTASSFARVLHLAAALDRFKR